MATTADATIRGRGMNPRVLIAGGGVAGLEAMIALRHHLGARADLQVLDHATELVHRPMSVAEPFGAGHPRRWPLADLCLAHGAEHLRDALTTVDVRRRIASTVGGLRVPFDVLVVAVGAQPDVAVPGALTFRGSRDAGVLRRRLEDARSGRVRRLVFAVPAGAAWSLPLYELALMTAGHLGGAPEPAELVLVTPELEPLGAFGPQVSAQVAALLAERGIRTELGRVPRATGVGGLQLRDGGVLPADAVVALPRLDGPWLGGLPHDRQGFLPTDPFGAVQDTEGVWAAGDCTAFPIKQGGLAAQQADTVAASIAATLGAPVEPEPFQPVVRAVLLDPRAPWYLRDSGDQPVSTAPQWWPGEKVATRYLSPYLADARSVPGEAATRGEAAPEAGHAAVLADREQVIGVLLRLATDSARVGEHALALRTLDAVETMTGDLPPDAADQRRRWTG